MKIGLFVAYTVDELITPAERLAMATKRIQKSKSYPKYHLIRRDDGLHVALKATDDCDDGDGWFSVGQIMDEENFETACDNAEEEFRCMVAEFGG